MNKKLLGVFAGALLCVGAAVPVHANSLTSSQVQSIVNLLYAFGADQSTINTVETALNGGTPTTNSSCYTFSSNLSIGASGSAVTALQTALQNDGEQVTVTGTYDDQTASAVTGFQQKYASDILTPVGLRYGTGYVGPSTRAKLNQLCTSGQQSTQTTPSTTTTSTVPVITGTSAKAAGNLEMYVGETADISGTDLNGKGGPDIYIGGTLVQSTYASDSMLTINVPTSLTPGQTYPLYVTNSYGTSNTVYVKIYGTASTCTINSFTASPSTITQGQSATLYWSATGCNSLGLVESRTSQTVGSGPSGSSGSVTVTPSTTTSYTFAASSTNGPNLTRTVTVTVQQPTSQSSSVSVTYPISGATLTAGQTYNIGWTGSAPTNATFSIGLGDVAGKGGAFVTGLSLSSYCSQTDSGHYTCSYPWPASVFGSENTNLQITVWIDNGSFPYPQGASGAFSVSGGQGSVTTTSNLTNSQIQSILSLLASFSANSTTIANATTVLNGGSVSSSGSSNLTDTQVQSVVSLLSSFGADSTMISNMKNVLTSSVPPPVVNVYSQSSIIAGQSFTLSWTSTNASSCSLAATDGYNDNGSWGKTSLATSGSMTVIPYPSAPSSYTAQYTVTCTGPGGSLPVTASVVVQPGAAATPTISSFSVNTNQQFLLSAQNFSTLYFKADCGPFIHVVVSYDGASVSYPTGDQSFCNTALLYPNWSTSYNHDTPDIAAGSGGEYFNFPNLNGISYVGNGPGSNVSENASITAKVCNIAGVCVQKSASFPVYGKACLAAGTTVLMSDGSHKNIEDIKAGDSVASFDGGRMAAEAVMKVVQREDPLLTINGTLQAAPDEPVYLADGKTEIAGDLQIGDRLLGDSGRAVTVTTITHSSELAKTYDLVLANGGAFSAEGYLVQALSPASE